MGEPGGARTTIGPPRRGWLRLAPWVAVPAVLAGLILEQARWVRASTSETYDEPTYLVMGLCIFRDGNFKHLASPMCPPLPILLEYGLPALRARAAYGTDAWWAESPGLIRQARLLTALTAGVPLAWLVFAWLARRRGWAVGAIGGGLVAFSPTVLASASLATTDACFACFAVLALAALRRYQSRPGRRSYLLAGAALGLALGAKQSAAVLFGVALTELLLRGPPARRPGWTGVDVGLRFAGRVAARLLGLVALAFLVAWGLYGFRTARYGSIGTSTTLPVVIPMVADLLPGGAAITEFFLDLGMPLAVDTFVGQMNHAAEGHFAYLMGMRSRGGWWSFFPVVLAVKSTPAELALMALALGLACRPATWRDPARRLWLGAGLWMLGAGLASRINIGQRYMILIYPLVILLGADRLGSIAGRRRPWALGAGALLVAWQAAGALGVAPHYLAYFNSLCGGPMAGHRYLVDSSLDWGQDLPALRRELEARGYRRVALGYFGTAQPARYGIRSVDWRTRSDAEAAEADYLAISATALMGPYSATAPLSDRFGGLPSARAGYSIFLYDLKDPRVRAAWDEARRGAPAFEGEAISPGRPGRG